MGEELYKKAFLKLDNCKKKIKYMQDILGSISQEIRDQNIQLLRIDELIRDSQNQFKRVKEMIEFFSKTFYKQKIMKLMITLMFILCVGIILLLFLDGGDDTASTEAPADNAAAFAK